MGISLILTKKYGHELMPEQIDMAIKSAKRKQQRIYAAEGKPYILDDWYLLTLAEEAVVERAFSDLTFALCEIKKEQLNANVNRPVSTPYFSRVEGKTQYKDKEIVNG